MFVPQADNYINSNRFRENLSNEFKWANIPENISDFTHEDTAKFEQIKENQIDLLSKWILDLNTQSGEGKGGGRKKKTRKEEVAKKKRVKKEADKVKREKEIIHLR